MVGIRRQTAIRTEICTPAVPKEKNEKGQFVKKELTSPTLRRHTLKSGPGPKIGPDPNFQYLLTYCQCDEENSKRCTLMVLIFAVLNFAVLKMRFAVLIFVVGLV